MFNAKEYAKSKKLFERARDLNPSDTYPPEKITEIDKILAELEKANAEKAKRAKYEELMSKADALRDAKSWEEAKTAYKTAHDVIPTETRPQEEIDKINKFLKENSGKEAYQKIIDKADELFNAKEYVKSKKLFERAKGLNPSDSYPPAQISKINDILAGLESEAELNRKYQAFIEKGDDGFDAEQYKKALENYRSALDLKPNESYPQKRIEEINRLMNKKVEPVTIVEEKPKPTNLGDIPKYNFEQYGEEVSDLQESDADNILQQSKINEENRKDMASDNMKEELFEKESKKSLSDADFSDKTNEEIEKYKEQLTDEQQSLDEKSKEHIPEVEKYKEEHANKSYEKEEQSKEITFDVNRAKEEYKSERTQATISLEERSREHVPEIETYVNERENATFESTIENKDRTNAVYEATTEYNSEREVATIDLDNKQKERIPDVETYINEKANSDFEKEKEAEDFTYNNYDNKEQLINRFEEINQKADIPRQEVVEEVDAYKKELTFERFEKNKDAQESTYEVMYGSENFVAKQERETQALDEAQKERIPNVENFKETEARKQLSESEQAIEKTLEVEVATEALTQKREQEQEEIQEVNAEIVEKVESYKNKKENQDIATTEESINRVDSRVDDFEQIKVQKPTKFTDEMRNYLASQFPEGVTEKTFQRKDKNGDVYEVTTVRIVVHGNKGDEYKKVATRWATTYFKNGVAISAQVWDTETN